MTGCFSQFLIPLPARLKTTQFHQRDKSTMATKIPLYTHPVNRVTFLGLNFTGDVKDSLTQNHSSQEKQCMTMMKMKYDATNLGTDTKPHSIGKSAADMCMAILLFPTGLKCVCMMNIHRWPS